jgi:hypothetical protein
MISYQAKPATGFFAVLHIPPTTGPREAMLAAIVAEAQAEK